MVLASDQTVDLNSIPIPMAMAMVESIEIISGGAAAVYGADAVAGVVNIKLKKRSRALTCAPDSRIRPRTAMRASAMCRV
jgi:outer membrane receptor for ferrienterochelin and colicin